VVPSALVTLNLQRNYDIGFYVHQEQQQALFNYEFRNNQSFIKIHNDSVVSPALKKIHTRTTELLKVINNIESKMIAESEGESGMPAVLSQQIKITESGPEIQFGLLSHPFNTEPVRDFLQPDCSARKELNTAANEYSDYLFKLIPGGELQKFEKLLDPSIYLNDTYHEGNYVSLMSALHKLGLLKNSILTVESIAFQSFQTINNK
jgi:hypothetical protein